jgi:hypothetical protein
MKRSEKLVERHRKAAKSKRDKDKDGEEKEGDEPETIDPSDPMRQVSLSLSLSHTLNHVAQVW